MEVFGSGLKVVMRVRVHTVEQAAPSKAVLPRGYLHSPRTSGMRLRVIVHGVVHLP